MINDIMNALSNEPNFLSDIDPLIDPHLDSMISPDIAPSSSPDPTTPSRSQELVLPSVKAEYLVDRDNFRQRRETPHLFFVHSGLTALMARLYIQRYAIPQENIYVVHGVIGNKMYYQAFKDLVAGDESRLFDASDISNKFWESKNPGEAYIRYFYYELFSEFIHLVLNKIHEQKPLSGETNNEVDDQFHDLPKVSNDFVVVCSNLDHFVTRAFYEHPQCCKLIMYEEGTSVYLAQLEVPNLGEDYEGRITDFLLNHQEWSYENSQLIPPKLVSHTNIMEVSNPRIGREYEVEIYRLNNLAYQHLEAAWHQSQAFQPHQQQPEYAQTRFSEEDSTVELAPSLKLQFIRFTREDIQKLNISSSLMPQLLGQNWKPFVTEDDREGEHSPLLNYQLSPSLQAFYLAESSQLPKEASEPQLDLRQKLHSLPEFSLAQLPWAEKLHILPLDNVPRSLFVQEQYENMIRRLLTQIKQTGVTQLLVKIHHNSNDKHREILVSQASQVGIEIFQIGNTCLLESEYAFHPKNSMVIHSIASSTLIYAQMLGQEVRCYFEVMDEYPRWKQLYVDLGFDIEGWLSSGASSNLR